MAQAKEKTRTLTEAEYQALLAQAAGEVKVARKPKRKKLNGEWTDDPSGATVIEVKVGNKFPMRHGDEVWRTIYRDDVRKQVQALIDAEA